MPKPSTRASIASSMSARSSASSRCSTQNSKMVMRTPIIAPAASNGIGEWGPAPSLSASISASASWSSVRPGEPAGPEDRGSPHEAEEPDRARVPLGGAHPRAGRGAQRVRDRLIPRALAEGRDDLVDLVHEDLVEDVVFGGKVPEERPRGHLHRGGDLLDGHRLVAALEKEPCGNLGELPARPRHAPLCQRRGPFGFSPVAGRRPCRSRRAGRRSPGRRGDIDHTRLVGSVHRGSLAPVVQSCDMYCNMAYTAVRQSMTEGAATMSRDTADRESASTSRTWTRQRRDRAPVAYGAIRSGPWSPSAWAWRWWASTPRSC